MRWRFGLAFGLLPLLCLIGIAPLRGSSVPQTLRKPASAEDIEFFEKKVRPVLAEQCVPCHSGAEPSGNLRLDRLSHLFGGAGGRALIAPGEPDKSILIHAVRYTVPALRMPPAGKLPSDQLALLEEWVKRGAPIPAEKMDAGPAPKPAGFPLTERRKHWAYRPVVRPAVPKVKNTTWGRNPIDAFLLHRLEAAGLKPATPADRRTLIRRVTFDLTGLPPTPAEIKAFLNDTRPGAYERVVERLLASPAYGERWGRHWLDLVRFGEGMGHEFDYEIPNAYQYRDYVIRAMNADVPYDRFVREHIAGDLMAEPRFDPKTGKNESVIATGFWWLGEGKHSPVDVKQEQADRIDNQIDVFGKAFLGQTIACARCHDHKFDPIPTKDYYALYGILKSSRYQQAQVDAPARFAEPAKRLDILRNSVSRSALAAAWRIGLAAIPDAPLQEATAKIAPAPVATDTAISDLGRWRSTGTAFSVLGRPGDLITAGSGERPGASLLSRTTAHSGLRSTRFEGALRSPTFTIDRDFLHLRLAGQKGRVHIIVENFELIRDPIYGPLSWTVDSAAPAWHSVDMRLWKGRRAYIELSDSPLSNLSQGEIAPANKPFDGWLRLDAVVRSDQEKPPVRKNTLTGKSAAEIRAALSDSLNRWERNALTPGDADALDSLDALLRAGLLETTLLADRAREAAAITETIPIPTRVLAMCEGDGEDEAVFLRGSHKTPGDIAPRLDIALCFRDSPSAPAEAGSGRRELAAWITSPQHPLTARVMVNRLWKHHFSVGLVASPDDFGHMGEKPTHPELLDWLASEFIRRGWSLKAMHRLMVQSSAYRMSSIPAAPAVVKRKDAKNALLHAMPVRRLEAEAIRDSILSVSGRLDRTLYGPSILVYLSEFSDGRGRPGSGPLDGKGRRTLYLGIRRNFLSPWLLAFDFPTPFTTMGRRTVSNVPAQALALMNGPFVREQAQVWATRLQKQMPNATTEARIAYLYETAFGRLPTPPEAADAKAFLGKQPTPDAWADFCHVLFNVKEFLYVR
jgi:hypothetical protein